MSRIGIPEIVRQGRQIANATTRLGHEFWLFTSSGVGLYNFHLNPLLRDVIIDLHGSPFLKELAEEQNIGLLTGITHLFDSRLTRRDKRIIFNPLRAEVEIFREETGQDPLILDIASYGGILRRKGLENPGTAMGLLDKSKKTRKYDREHGIILVSGDISESSTWHNERTLTKDRRYDLILGVPIGGIHVLPADPHFYARILRRSYERLSEKGGIIAINFHESMTEYVARMCEELNQIPGITASIMIGSPSIFVLTKSTEEGAPDKLPFRHTVETFPTE